MALYSLIFNRPVKASIETIIGTERIVVPFDVSLSESHERNATVTQNPIEDGSNISDHINLNPERLTLEGMISDSPVSLIQSAVGLGVSSATQFASSSLGGGLVGNLVKDATGVALGSVAGLVTGTPRDPADGFKFMEELWRNREPFTVITALKRYENMVIENLSVPRSAQIGKSFRFSATFVQVKIAKSSIVTIPAFKVNGNTSAQSKAALGKQATKEAKAETQRQSSFLLQGFQKVGAFTG